MPNAPLDPIEIFRAGTRTDVSGQRVTITEADLAAAAAAYDPAGHPAPLVVGHPRIEDPAYGWVERLEADGPLLRAVPERVEAAFAQVVRDGRYRNVSACFYKPDGRGNPVPGTWYLKHVGFLGAHPPAVTGLAPVQFAEDADTVSFAFADRSVARLFRGLREWIIGKFGTEEADQVLPSWEVDTLQEEAGRPVTEPAPAFAAPAHTQSTTTEDPQMTADPAATAELERLRAEAAEKDRQLAAFAAAETARRAADDRSFVDRLVGEARVPAGHREEVAAFMARLEDGETVAFAEGREAETPRAWFRRFLAGLAPTVAFGEVAGAAGRAAEPTPTALVEAARRYQAEQAAIGNTVSWAAAVDHVSIITEVTRA